ncbi:hypothetical protein [Campylobacter vulpis]|nr:hypothetical protein [Campylobacter vulpis]
MLKITRKLKDFDEINLTMPFMFLQNKNVVFLRQIIFFSTLN